MSDEYINYLKSFNELKMVSDNKEDKRIFTRKYLGVVLENNGFNYFIPLSTPKENDFIKLSDGKFIIRKSSLQIIRMIAKNTVSNQFELKGTLKICNMIPVPADELSPYDISKEKDRLYQSIVQKEYSFIRSNRDLILRNASIIYNLKNNEHKIFPNKNKRPKYLDNTIPFSFAEQKCREYIDLKNKLNKAREALLEKNSPDILS